MAQQTIIASDLSGKPDASTISFSVDSRSYEIDLTKQESDELIELLRPYMDVARLAPLAAQEYDPADVRAWAQTKGIEISPRGRIKQSVLNQYLLEKDPGSSPERVKIDQPEEADEEHPA